MTKQSQLPQIKVLIGLPSRGEIKGDTALCLSFLTYTLGAEPVIQYRGGPAMLLWNIKVVYSSILPQSRQSLVGAALANDVDFLFFMDDDMTFSERILHDWIAEDRAVIAANCPTRGIPCYATARQHDPQNHKGKVVYSDVANMRFEKVWRVGTGLMLMRKDALQALPVPAFTPRWEPEHQHYVGEDWAMCEHLEAAGIPIYVDHKHSLDVGHIGGQTFTHEMAAGTRKAEARQSGIILPRANVPILPSEDSQ